MQIIDIKALKRRNIYSHQPVIIMTIDLEELCDIPTNELDGFNEGLIKLFPGLWKHNCSKGYEGGFAERLEEGTYLAHVIEHLALEFQTLMGYDVGFGKARIKDGSIYNIIFAYMVERVGLEAGRSSVRIANNLIKKEHIQLDTICEELRRIALKHDLGPSTKAIIEEATNRGIPVTRLGNDSIMQLGYGKYQKRIEATITENTSCISVDIACNKLTTKEMLMDVGIPVPEGGIAEDVYYAVEVAEGLGYPLVVKPCNGNQGKGVSLQISNKEEVITAFNIAKQFDEIVIIERYIEGKDYRVLVVGDRVVAVSKRIPAHVIGDGVHTIKQLVDCINSNRLRGEGHEKPLTKISIDDISNNILSKKGMDIGFIPKKNQVVYLKQNANISMGGIALDYTDRIHPYNIQIAVRAARTIGLDVAGIDITAKNISMPLNQCGGCIIEVNAAPGIRMHHYPYKGKKRNVARAIVDMLYPYEVKHSIPIISITGTNGKTTTTRMVSHILKVSGLNVGMTTTGGVYINDKCVDKGDTTGPESARIILTDRTVDVAVLETARGGIIHSGLGYDLSDIGVITNISEDHLGIDGINSVEEMAFVKSLVVEAVKKNGFVILNADDPMTPKIAERVKVNIIYFSVSTDNLIVKKHIMDGNTAVFIKDSYITISERDSISQVIEINQIPATYGGILKHNIHNSLAAVGSSYGLGIPVSVIEKGLKTFYNDQFQNPGRFNLFNINNFRIVVDYGHNVDGYREVAEAVSQMGATRLIGIIGVPGDRMDDSIISMGKIAGESFDSIIIKEDKYGRGRTKGEVAKLLMDGCLRAGKAKKNIRIIQSELEALKYAVENAQPGDLIAIFYEEFEPVLQYINSLGFQKANREYDYATMI